ncbi:hypothetical protein BA768_11285 [Chryseobacterium sp. CBo1]|nr:hypothetical protein BA768_11285 [Chryseobacterium sp. CBo1]
MNVIQFYNQAYFLYQTIYKVRKPSPILKEENTKRLTFNLKSFPHLHETPFAIGLEELKLEKQIPDKDNS